MNEVKPAVPHYGPAHYGERRAMPIESMRNQLDQMLGGLPTMEPAALADLNKPTQEQQQAAAIALRLLGSAEGVLLLEFLADNSVRRPHVLPPIGTDPAQAYCHVQRRAGQDDMFFFLLKLIAMGRQEIPPTREGDQL